MGKREGFPGAVQRRTFDEKKRSQNLVWVPKMASWEKEFCYKVGLFEWENFLEAKKETKFSHSKVWEWNDSAAEEAFHRSKSRFFASINGLPVSDDSEGTNPDLYIDEIDWSSSNVDEEDKDDEEEEEEEEEEGSTCVPDYYRLRIEDIKPMGWDFVAEEEFSPAKVLTGYIISCN